MPHTLENLVTTLNDISRTRISEQLYLSGFKKNDCDYGKLHLTWATDPLSKDYYSILNPCFSYEPRTPELLNAHPCWMIRDGALPLIDALTRELFYNVKTKFIFHQSLQRVLPEAMQEQALYYDLIPLKHDDSSRKKVLIYALVNGAYTSPEHFSEILRKARDLRRDLKEKDFYIMLLLRENQFYQVDSDSVHPAIVFPKIVKKIIPNATLITERQFEQIKDFSEFSFVDAQENSIVIGDSYLNHVILSRCGHPLFPIKKLGSKSHLFAQSPNHAIRVAPAQNKVVPSIYPEAKKILTHMKANEIKIKSYWVPPYSENPTFGCFYQWLRQELANA